MQIRTVDLHGILSVFLLGDLGGELAASCCIMSYQRPQFPILPTQRRQHDLRAQPEAIHESFPARYGVQLRLGVHKRLEGALSFSSSTVLR